MNKSELSEIFRIALHEISDQARLEFTDKSRDLIHFLDTTIENRDDVDVLLGGRPMELLQQNHVNHAKFMSSIFALKSGSGFVETVIWVYRAYRGRGISADYFPIALEAWKQGVNKFLSPDNVNGISNVYSLMIKYHDDFYELSLRRLTDDQHDAQYETLTKEYLNFILEPNMKKALDMAFGHIKTVKDVQIWWMNIIEPAMREVGKLWEEGSISVGQEHLATSITQRVMSAFYYKILEAPRPKGSVILSATPGELHEIGARMVADLLEIDGWDVHYTGANTPADSVISLVHEYKPRFLLLSTTLITHLDKVIDLVKLVKGNGLKHPPKVIVGGLAYAADQDLWKVVNADGFAGSAQMAINSLNELSRN